MLRRIAVGALALTVLPGLTACSAPPRAERAAAVAPAPSTTSTTTSSTITTTTSTTTTSTTTVPEPTPASDPPAEPPPPPRARAAPPAPETIEELIRTEFGPLADQALSVAWCESRYRPAATNGPSRGLFQVHEVHADQWLEVVGRSYWTSWDDPAANAAFAHWLHDAAGSWSAWSCKP